MNNIEIVNYLIEHGANDKGEEEQDTQITTTKDDDITTETKPTITHDLIEVDSSEQNQLQFIETKKKIQEEPAQRKKDMNANVI